jgi:ribosomal subunit interface protein
MNVDVQSKNLEVTSALRDFIRRQVSKLSHHSYPIEKVTAFVEKVKRKKNDMYASLVKLRVELPGRDVVVEHTGADVYETVADVTARTSRALLKRKEKHTSRRQGVG